MAKTKKALGAAVRITVSAALITFLIIRNLDNFKSIIEQARQLDLLFLSAAVVLYFLGIAGMVFRWGILLQAQGIRVERSFLFQSVMIGFFYNNILPTSIGGDAYRIYDLFKNKKIGGPLTVSTVVLERMMGTLTGIVFLLLSFLFGMYRILSLNMVISLLAVLLLMLLLLAILANPYFFKIDVLFGKYRLLRKIRPKISSFRRTLMGYRHKKSYLFICFLYSLIIQMLIVASYWMVSRSQGLEMNYSVFLFIVPFTSLVASIPITIGGIGLRENALAFLIAAFGASASQAALFSFIILFIILFNALLGGAIYLIKNIFFKSRGII